MTRSDPPSAAATAEARLRTVLVETGQRWTIAVSGGVDSVTLAAVAHRVLATPPVMVHAVSPAVPEGARERLETLARAEGWTLRIVSTGEMRDPSYRSNPYDRCYFCKSALYTTMLRDLALHAGEGALMASGANTDDLGEHRPGLLAAAEHGVRHPLIEAGIDKATLRAIARQNGLTGFSELPAQPCLASRVQTGIQIEPHDLRFIDRLEAALKGRAGARVTLRARLLRDGIAVELDAALCADDALVNDLEGIATRACAESGHAYAGLRPYRRGSAFVKALER